MFNGKQSYVSRVNPILKEMVRHTHECSIKAPVRGAFILSNDVHNVLVRFRWVEAKPPASACMNIVDLLSLQHLSVNWSSHYNVRYLVRNWFILTSWDDFM